jgi:hypothetical protein
LAFNPAKIWSHANTVQSPSFSLTWFDPVPNDSSPHKAIKSYSIKFPKNFHPVGVSKHFTFNYLATLSIAPEVGMLLATPISFFFMKS